MAERIAKYISASGHCSRRAAERLIEQGEVKVDGKIISTPATLVDENSVIEVEGKVLKKITQPRIWILNKPTGYVCTANDEMGRPTIYDLLPPELKQLHYIGRLDINSEGLLMLTDSGEVKRYYEHPSNKVPRVYLARVFGNVPRNMFGMCAKGIALMDKETGKRMTYTAKVESHRMADEGPDGGKNSWLKFTLKEGKNREIRRICEFFGLSVSKLRRVSYGDFRLGSLERGKYMEV